MFLKTALALFAVLFVACIAETQGPAVPRSRVVAINYGIAFTKCDRAIELTKALQNELQPLKLEAEQIKALMKKLKESVDGPKVPKEFADQVNERFGQQQKRLEELDKTAKERIDQRQANELVPLWMDVKNAVSDYAKAHDLDVVLAYGDPLTDIDGLSNISRKMGGMDVGSAVPVYIRNGADITNDILEKINKAYHAQKNATR